MQLLQLWRGRPLLKRQLDMWEDVPHMRKQWKGAFMQPHDRGAFCFVPLVTENQFLYAELDILFLRAEAPGRIFATNQGGDLDNRLKVLFDALRVPESSELPPAANPSADEEPFFCLLQNDYLITAARVESERLLVDAAKPERDRVRLVVRVTVKAHEFSKESYFIVAD